MYSRVTTSVPAWMCRDLIMVHLNQLCAVFVNRIDPPPKIEDELDNQDLHCFRCCPQCCINQIRYVTVWALLQELKALMLTAGNFYPAGAVIMLLADFGVIDKRHAWWGNAFQCLGLCCMGYCRWVYIYYKVKPVLGVV
jgi:hypothetical protein